MADGVAVAGILTLPDGGDQAANADVTRSAPDGLYTLLPLATAPFSDNLLTAYPYLWHPDLEGAFVHSFFDDYYNRIHVFPNPLDFGYIASESIQTFQVWNAYLTTQHLDSVTLANDAGLVVTGGPLSNFDLLGLEAITYTVTASITGPGQVDATYTFAFTGLPAITLSIHGSRVILFPFEPNWAASVIERLEWLTAVNTMRYGAEERAKLRQHPRQTLEYSFLLHSDYQRLLPSLLFGWQGRAWGVPLWVQGQKASTPILSGDTSIVCATEGYEFQVGGSVVIYSDAMHYEALTIVTITSTGLTLSSSAVSNWPAGIWLFPLRVGQLQGSPTFRKITGDVVQGSVQFKSQTHRHEDSTWAVTYKGRPVLEIVPQWKDGIEEVWTRNTTTLDYEVGQWLTFDKDPFSRAVRKADYLSLSKAKLTNFRAVTNFAEGRLKSFWAPTFDQDLRLVENVADNDSTLIIAHQAYTRYVDMHPLRNHIRVQLLDGSVHYREIVGADDVNTPAGTETLTVSPAFLTGFAVDQVRLLSWMPLCRLESDIVEFSYITMHVANAGLSLHPTLDEQLLV